MIRTVAVLECRQLVAAHAAARALVAIHATADAPLTTHAARASAAEGVDMARILTPETNREPNLTPLHAMPEFVLRRARVSTLLAVDRSVYPTVDHSTNSSTPSQPHISTAVP